MKTTLLQSKISEIQQLLSEVNGSAAHPINDSRHPQHKKSCRCARQLYRHMQGLKSQLVAEECFKLTDT